MVAFDNPLCVALDSPDPQGDLDLAALGREVGLFKVGSTAFTTFGPQLVTTLTRTRPVFLDLKLHDIPAQVAGAVDAAARGGASLLTVHAAGGADMVRAACDAAGGRLGVVAVTVLTSLDQDSLRRIGLEGRVDQAVLRLAELALASGADGVVCSPLEVAALRARFGDRTAGGPLLVVPGIRPSGAAQDDQRRTLAPQEAIAAGADVIVVGRPITAASDPVAVARAISSAIRAA